MHLPIYVLASLWHPMRNYYMPSSSLMLSQCGIVMTVSRICAQAGSGSAHLYATAYGVTGRLVNEAVELIDYRRSQNREQQAQDALADFIGDKTWQPIFMFCMGYPIRQVLPSRGRPVRDILL